MLASSAPSFALYILSFFILQAVPAERLDDPYGAMLWLFIFIVMLAVIAGNIRAIALATTVTLLVPEDRRDKANGLAGMVPGIAFPATWAISGFLVAWGGMVATLGFALAFTILVFVHLSLVRVDEPRPEPGRAWMRRSRPGRPRSGAEARSRWRAAAGRVAARARSPPARSPARTRT